MSEAKCFHLSRGGSCKLPSCNHQRVELQVVDWTGCGGEAREESFDVTAWTPAQFTALRSFIASGAGSAPISPDDLKRIDDPPLRLFHLLHSVFGAEEITRFYSLSTIRAYRRRLRDAGFDYPVRNVPTGPGTGRAHELTAKPDVLMTPQTRKKVHRSPVPGPAGREGAAAAKGALRP